MTVAQIIMLSIGAVALAGGLLLIGRSGRGTDRQRTARRMVGTMAAALGVFLALFALGLAGQLESTHA